MMRLKQIVMLSGFGVVCTLLYLVVHRDVLQQDDISSDVLQKVNHIITHSEGFTYPMQNISEKKSSKSHSDVIIEDENNLLSIAKRISAYNRTVLVTMVNDAYLSFTYSWLCNTKNMGIHRSVLIITTDEVSKINLTRDWPAISVVSLDIGAKGDQTYSKVGYVKIMVKRTEMILSILMADIEVFLFEVDCLWLANPVPELQRTMSFDILVNPVANTNNQVFAGGFLWLYTTDKAKALWKKLTEEMIALGQRISQKSDNAAVSEGDNDQQYFSRLINRRYMNVSIKILPLDIYADGKWYQLPEKKRKKSRPVVINNNWVLAWIQMSLRIHIVSSGSMLFAIRLYKYYRSLKRTAWILMRLRGWAGSSGSMLVANALGNKAKIDRAKQWKHWFIHEDLTCDMELVNKTVY